MKKIFVLFIIAIGVGIAPIAMAAKLVPAGAPETAAPLQPLPENTGPDISNSVDVQRVQPEEPTATGQVGPGFPGQVVPPSPSGSDQSGVILNTAPVATDASAPKSHTALIVIVIILVLVGIAGSVWLNNQSNKEKRKFK